MPFAGTDRVQEVLRSTHLTRSKHTYNLIQLLQLAIKDMQRLLAMTGMVQMSARELFHISNREIMDRIRHMIIDWSV